MTRRTVPIIAAASDPANSSVASRPPATVAPAATAATTPTTPPNRGNVLLRRQDAATSPRLATPSRTAAASTAPSRSRGCPSYRGIHGKASIEGPTPRPTPDEKDHRHEQRGRQRKADALPPFDAGDHDRADHVAGERHCRRSDEQAEREQRTADYLNDADAVDERAGRRERIVAERGGLRGVIGELADAKREEHRGGHPSNTGRQSVYS